jgi:hypothetical protein
MTVPMIPLEVDPLACPSCQGAMRVIAVIEGRVPSLLLIAGIT